MIDISKLKNHSAGPWKYEACGVYTKDGHLLFDYDSGIDNEADAYLIAAAPELFEEVIRLRDEIEVLNDIIAGEDA